MLGAQEPLGDGVVEETQQQVEVAERIEQPDRLCVQAQLSPGGHLGELVERPQATGQGDEPIGELDHRRLALVHGADHPQVREAGVGDLGVDERLAG